MTKDLQRIVVLCVFISVVVLIGYILAQPPQSGDSVVQTNPLPLDSDISSSSIDINDVDGLPLPDDIEQPYPEPQPVACTMDAKRCPDGSFVGRTGPDCKFAACPSETGNQTMYCTAGPDSIEACTDVYEPVCGLVEVQCITTPCNPVPQTFSNTCYACAQGNVISYTEGACVE